MRTLGYSVLAASLLVGFACTKKDESSGDAKQLDAKQLDIKVDKVDDKKASDSKPDVVDQPSGGGFAANAASSAQLTASGFPASVGLIPDRAELVVGFSMSAIMASPLYALAAGEQNGELQEMVAVFKDCGLDPGKFESIVIGFSQTEDLAAVVVGEGIGEGANAACVIKNIQKQAGDPQVADVVDKDGKQIIEFTDGRAFLVDGRTVAFATTAWASAVSDLIDGKGTAAASNSKKDLFAKVNGSAAVWGVATVPAELAGMAPLFGAPTEFSSVRSLAGSVDLRAGLTLDVLAGFDNEDTAKAVATKVQGLVGEASKDAPTELAGMIQRMKVEAAGSDLKVVLTATVDELSKAKEIEF